MYTSKQCRFDVIFKIVIQRGMICKNDRCNLCQVTHKILCTFKILFLFYFLLKCNVHPLSLANLDFLH
jgi:hypothetical protein